jgi:transposase-like protein
MITDETLLRVSYQTRKNWKNGILAVPTSHKTRSQKGMRHDSNLTTIKRLSKCDQLNTTAICKNCGIEYPVRISEMANKKRMFCSLICSGKFNGSKKSSVNKKDINPEKVQTLIDQGLSVREISIIFGCSIGPINRVIKESKLSFKKQVVVNFVEYPFPPKGAPQ